MEYTNVDTRAYPVSKTYTFKLLAVREIEIRSFKETLEKFASVKLYSESSFLLEMYIEIRGRTAPDIDEFEKKWKQLHEKYKKIYA
jgi:hypothetical protein